MKTISALFAALILAASLALSGASALADENTIYVKTAADWFDQE